MATGTTAPGSRPLRSTNSVRDGEAMTARASLLALFVLAVPLVASCAPAVAAARPPLARVVTPSEEIAQAEESTWEEDEPRLGSEITEDPLPAVAPQVVPAPVLFGLGQVSP